MSNNETAIDYNAFTQLAFGDLDFRPINVDEEYDTSEGWDGTSELLSGSMREDDTYSEALEMFVGASEEFHLVKVDGQDENTSLHVLVVKYELCDFCDYICLDNNKIIDEIQDHDYDAKSARDRIVKVLSAIADKRLGLG